MQIPMLQAENSHRSQGLFSKEINNIYLTLENKVQKLDQGTVKKMSYDIKINIMLNNIMISMH